MEEDEVYDLFGEQYDEDFNNDQPYDDDFLKEILQVNLEQTVQVNEYRIKLKEQLQTNLEINGLKVSDDRIPEDGNCLFHCFSTVVGASAKDIREEVVKYIRTHSTVFEDFVSQLARKGSHTLNDYLKDLAKDGVFGDEASLRAFSEQYKNRVYMVSSHQVVPVIYGDEAWPTLYLGNLQDYHYVRAVLKESTDGPVVIDPPSKGLQAPWAALFTSPNKKSRVSPVAVECSPKSASKETDRNFKGHWKTKERWWLRHDKGSSKMFCDLCIAHKQENSFTKGSSSFRLQTIEEHERVTAHERLYDALTNKSADNFKKAATKQVEKAESAYLNLFRNAYFLVKEDISLLKFPSICALSKAQGVALPATNSSLLYQHKHAAKDMALCFSEILKKDLKAKIAESPFVSIFCRRID
eukprot:Pompholyxophrys_sp_v1_NODE_38_length_3314_cov_8.176434.p2 type:complete len:411 gc:universal NODE_38_length_3314_cov_8.176434:2844-1612(-)